jgi:hypothetical protein
MRRACNLGMSLVEHNLSGIMNLKHLEITKCRKSRVLTLVP